MTVISDRSPFESLMKQEFTSAAEARGVEVIDRATGAGNAAQAEGASYDVGAQTLELPGGGPVLRTSAMLDPSRLPADPGTFTGAFSQRFNRPPGPAAAYGFEAMALVLQVIAGAGTDASDFRDNVREGVFGAERRESVLGEYSIGFRRRHDRVHDPALPRTAAPRRSLPAGVTPRSQLLRRVTASAPLRVAPPKMRLAPTKRTGCGVWAVNIASGDVVGFLRFEEQVQEIFEVALLPGIRFPEIVERGSPIAQSTWVLPAQK